MPFPPLSSRTRRRLCGALAAALGAGAACSAWAAAPAPDPANRGGVSRPELACDAWSAKYTSDPLVDLDAIGPDETATVILLRREANGARNLGPVRLPDAPAAFPPDAFPEPLTNAGVLITFMAKTILYRRVAGPVVETLVFRELDAERPALEWSRQRLGEDGPFDTVLVGDCRRLGSASAP